MTRSFFAAVLLILSCIPLCAQFDASRLNENTMVNNGISFLEDKEGKLGIEDVMNSNAFQKVENDVSNFGISPSTYWLKVQIFSAKQSENLLLQVPQPNLDEIDFYSAGANGKIMAEKGGECLPFSVRHFFDPGYIYRIRLDSMKVSTFFFRIRSRDNFQVPVIIGKEENIFKSNKVRDFILGLFAGIMVVMLLYNAFLYATVRDKTYLYYVIYLATVILTQVSIQGYTFQYLWPGSPFLAQWSPFIFSPMVGIASAVFMRIFLHTASFCPRLDKGFKYFFGAYIFAFLLSVIGQFHFSYLLITLCATFLSLYMMVAAIVVYRSGFRPAKYFLIAWSVFLFGVTVYAMTNVGVLPNSNFTFYTMPFGAATEVVLLSLALADRINILKKEKEDSQEEALRISEENQKLIAEQNVLLEKKVHARTLELENANNELNGALSELKEAQTQLVNSEKMASLGQLTAGIAHEINNPINFVSANLKPLRMDINDVLAVMEKYEKINGAEGIEKMLDEIGKFRQQVDIDYVKKEIDQLLRAIEDGAGRTAEIVAGLRNFSRIDEADLKTVNINEGIESTMVLIRSSIPHNVEVVTNLGKIPNVECYPGKLNQVFMNVLTNAVHAIRQKGGDKLRLSIRTYEKGGKVYAEFEDTGIGMTSEVKQKIFEPFFTTKGIGEGTGLGMSIVYQIVESHHARLEVESAAGEGTRITLILNRTLEPVKAQKV
jgi:two-component system NtrC family sensor kinase